MWFQSILGGWVREDLGGSSDLSLLARDGEELTLLDGAGPGEARVAHQVTVDLGGASTALLNTPDDERLTTSAVTGGVDTLDVGLVRRLALLVVSLDVGATVLLETEPSVTFTLAAAAL